MLDLLKAIVDLNGSAEARVQSVLDPLCAGLLDAEREGQTSWFCSTIVLTTSRAEIFSNHWSLTLITARKYYKLLLKLQFSENLLTCAVIWSKQTQIYLDPPACSVLYVEAHDGIGLRKEVCVSQIVTGDVELHPRGGSARWHRGRWIPVPSQSICGRAGRLGRSSADVTKGALYVGFRRGCSCSCSERNAIWPSSSGRW